MPLLLTIDSAFGGGGGLRFTQTVAHPPSENVISGTKCASSNFKKPRWPHANMKIIRNHAWQQRASVAGSKQEGGREGEELLGVYALSWTSVRRKSEPLSAALVLASRECAWIVRAWPRHALNYAAVLPESLLSNQRRSFPLDALFSQRGGKIRVML